MMQENRPHRNDSNFTSEKPLQSWKEIAGYLERDERTARRWEKNTGLPVRRHGAGKGSSVYAYPSELEAWRAERQPQSDELLRGRHQQRRKVAVLAVVLAVLFAAWFLTYTPILNPPNPLVEADGITMRQVWAEDGPLDVGSPSPDGRYLSFVDWETGDLAIRDLSTEENRHVTNEGSLSDPVEFAFYESIFSPDSRHIAYIWRNKDQRDELRVIGVDGSAPRILYRGYAQPNDWSSDGKQVLTILWPEEGTAQIALISVEDGSVRVLKTIDRSYPLKMSLSPDDRYVVYDLLPSAELSARDIFLLSTETQEAIELVQHAADDHHPVWTPDGKHVIFVSDRTGSMGLWRVEVANGAPRGWPRLIKADIGRFSPMGFTGSGTLYLSLETGMFDVYLTKLDLRENSILENPIRVSQRFVGFNLMPDWSFDGKYLSYLSRRSLLQGHYWYYDARIVVRDLETGEEREIAPKLSSFGFPCWSPDGRFFLAVGRGRNGHSAVFKIDSKSGDTKAVFERKPLTNVRFLIWSRDGKAIFYRRVDFSGNSSLIRRDLESGHEQELFRTLSPEQWYSPALSRDGQYLAFLLENGETGTQAIHIIPSTGGESRQLVEVQEPETLVVKKALVWAPADQQILFVKRVGAESDKQTLALMAISVEGGEPRKLGPMMDHVHELSLHPDGTSLVYTAGQRNFEVWAMEDFLPEP